jgi:zinc/manganese transport system substrate-binding protein
MSFLTLLFVFVGGVPSAVGAVDVVTTTPDLASLARTVGGSQVTVSALTSSTRDPHYFNARPTMVTDLNRADLFVKNGLQLEIGWLPELMRQSRKSSVQPGGEGHVDASNRVPVLEVPEGPVDRSQGHVHPEGNPHYTLDPVRARYAAWNIAEGLERVDPDHSERYDTNLSSFYERAESLAKEQRKRFESIGTRGVIVYHQQWEYILDRLDLHKVDEIEPKPGVPPSASHIAKLTGDYNSSEVGAVLVAPWNDRDVAQRVADGIGVPLVEPCPIVGSCDGTGDILDLFRENSDRLYEALSEES